VIKRKRCGAVALSEASNCEEFVDGGVAKHTGDALGVRASPHWFFAIVGEGEVEIYIDRTCGLWPEPIMGETGPSPAAPPFFPVVERST
jgi:hypothetical protein